MEYAKTEDGQLKVIDTVEKTYNLQALINEKQRLDNRSAELGVLIEQAQNLGISEE